MWLHFFAAFPIPKQDGVIKREKSSAKNDKKVHRLISQRFKIVMWSFLHKHEWKTCQGRICLLCKYSSRKRNAYDMIWICQLQVAHFSYRYCLFVNWNCIKYPNMNGIPFFFRNAIKKASHLRNNNSCNFPLVTLLIFFSPRWHGNESLQSDWLLTLSGFSRFWPRLRKRAPGKGH